jgi:hypothetical protein
MQRCEDFLLGLGPLPVSTIISMLDTLPDYLVLARVCKAWEYAVLQYGNIATVKISQVCEIGRNRINLLKLIQKRNPRLGIRHLEFYRCSVEAFYVKQFLDLCRFEANTGLKILSLNSCMDLNEASIASLLFNSRLSLEEFRWNDSSQRFYCPHLITRFLSTNVLESQRFFNIKVFEFPSLENGTEFCLLEAFSGASLRVLNICMVKIQAEDIFSLQSSFETLEELSVCMHDYRVIRTFQFPNCPKLRKLELPDCNFRQTSIEFNLPSLKRLNIRHGNVSNIEGCFPELEYFDISYSSLSAKSVSLLISRSKCTKLKVARFNGSLIDKECIQVLKKVSSAAKIEMHSCRKIPRSFLNTLMELD